jgi:hypothetical protein
MQIRGTILCAAAIAVCACSRDTPKAPAVVAVIAAPPAHPQTPIPVDPGLFAPDDAHSDPDLFAQWGAAGIAEVNKLRKDAALAVSRNPQCGTVQVVELWRDSDYKAPKPFRVWIDCDPGGRFYVTEADLKALMRSSFDKAKELGNSVEGICLGRTRNQLAFPSSMSANILTMTKYESPATGNWTVEFDLKAQNEAGNYLPQHARCTVTPDGVAESSLADR